MTVQYAPSTISVRDAALELAHLGLVAVPLGSKRRPVHSGWPDADASVHATSARFACERIFGLAVVTRPPLFILDLDRNHAPGIDGVAAFAALVRDNGPVPLGPRVRSRRGGVHVWFRTPDGRLVRSSAGLLGTGIDVKAGRSIATCPPTPGYSWLTSPRDRLPPLAPDWLLDLVAPIRTAPIRAPFQPQAFTGTVHPYAAGALTRELATLAAAPVGRRNVTLFKAAASLGALAAGGALQAQAVADSLMEAARACGLIADDGQLAVEATVASGLKRGLESPRSIPEGPK